MHATGPTGHGSRFIENTAVAKLMSVCKKALAFRKEQEKCMSGGCKHAQAKKLGDVTTLNLTMLKAGVTSNNGKTFALNVVPTEAEAGFDIRVTPKQDLSDIRVDHRVVIITVDGRGEAVSVEVIVSRRAVTVVIE